MNLSFYRDEIKYFISKILRKNPQIYFFQYVLRRSMDEQFVSRVLQLDSNPNTVEIKKFGDKNPDRNIYFIEIKPSKGMGFAAYLRHTLLALFEAERLGFLPVVLYSSQNSLYAEDEAINGTKNPFEYYFRQVSDISVAEVYESSRVFLYKWSHSVRIERDLGDLNPCMTGGYIVDDAYIDKMSVVLKKYIYLNKIVQDQVFNDMQDLVHGEWDGKKILGVHIRGTDYALNWTNHPNMVGVDEFIEAIDELLSQHDYEYVFLATDDKSRLTTLIERYGSKLIYYKDVSRGEEALNIAMMASDRPRHHYLNGLEVVRDMYTLARCDSLVCGLSQVAFFARTIRLAESGSYTHLKVLDKGIYQG